MVKDVFSFLKGNKWMRILYVLGIVGFFVFITITDNTCSYEKGKGLSCGSKSHLNVEIKK